MTSLSTVPSPVQKMETPLFHLNLSSRIESMPVLPYRILSCSIKSAMMNDGKVDFSTYTYLMWRPVKSKLQPLQVNITIGADGYYRAKLLTLGWHWENFPLDNATFIFGSFSHLLGQRDDWTELDVRIRFGCEGLGRGISCFIALHCIA